MEEFPKEVQPLNIIDNQCNPGMNENILRNVTHLQTSCFTRRNSSRFYLVKPKRKAVDSSFIYFVIYFLCLFVTVIEAEPLSKQVLVNIGSPVSFSCQGSGLPVNRSQLSWRHMGKLNTSASYVTEESGSLVITNAKPSDAGVYTCSTEDGNEITRIELQVRNVPSRISKLTVSPHSIFAIVTWDPPYNGGYPILGYICQYREDASHTEKIQDYRESHVPTESETCSIYNLNPNTTYYVRVAAKNELGIGEFNSLMLMTRMSTQLEQSPPHSSAQNGYGRVLSWGFAVTFVLALTMGSAGIALLLIRQRTHCQPVRPLKESPEEDESLELVPHITLNPSFNIDMLEHLAADVNESSEHAFLVGSPKG